MKHRVMSLRARLDLLHSAFTGSGLHLGSRLRIIGAALLCRTFADGMTFCGMSEERQDAAVRRARD